MPLSIVGTFAVMYLLGYSLNNLTLMALTISTGFVVDDAIVMIENIARFIEKGESPIEAALKGSEQIGFTIISLTVSLIAVLVPLLFMGDIVGRLFREFAVTLAVTILISAAVSLTLTPMMAARLLKSTAEQSHGPFLSMVRAGVRRGSSEGYGRTLDVVLQYQTLMLIGFVATLVLTGYLYYVVPKGFFPVQDTGVIQAVSVAPQSVSFSEMAERQQALAQIITHDPAVESLSSFIGIDRNQYDPQQRAHADQFEAARQNAMRARARSFDASSRSWRSSQGMSVFMQPVQDITVDDRVSRTQFQFTLEDPDPDVLKPWAPRLLEKLQPTARDP